MLSNIGQRWRVGQKNIMVLLFELAIQTLEQSLCTRNGTEQKEDVYDRIRCKEPSVVDKL